MNLTNRRKKKVLIWIKAGFELLCGLAVSAYTVGGNCVPLGVAYVSAQLYNGFGAYSLIGVSLGYLLLCTGEDAFVYIGAAVCYVLGFVFFRKSAHCHNKLVISFATTAVLAVFMSFASVSGEQTDFIPGEQKLLFTLITFTATYIYAVTFSKEIYPGVCNGYDCFVGVFVGTALGGVFCLFGGREAILLCALICVFELIVGLFLPAERAIKFSVGLCLALILCGAVSVNFVILLICICLISRYIYTVRHITLVLFVCVGIVMLSLALTNDEVSIITAASLVFTVGAYLLVPPYVYAKSFIILYPLLYSKCTDDYGERFHAFNEESLCMVSIMECLSQKNEERRAESDFNDLIKFAFDDVCAECSCTGKCMIQESLHTEELYNVVANVLIDKGRLRDVDMPQSFMEQCCCSKDLIFSVNRKLTQEMNDMRMGALMNMDQTHALAQLSVVMQMMDEISTVLVVTDDAKKYKRIFEFIFMLYNQPFGVEVFQTSFGGLCVNLCGDNSDVTAVNERYLKELSAMVGINFCSYRPPECENFLELYERPAASVEVGIAQKKRYGECVCGDSVKAFVTRYGMFYAVIVDGNGSGEEAAAESQLAIGFLERLLQHGIGAQYAVSLLQNVMYFRNMDFIKSVAVDLLSVNLFSGEASLYKLGAADSYVLMNSNVHRYSGDSFPAGTRGIEKNNVDCWRFRMNAGDLCVMTSDGVSIDRAMDLKKQNFKNQCGGLKAAARRILSDYEQSDFSDDMTVLVIGLRDKL